MAQIIKDEDLISIMNGTNKNGKKVFLAIFEPRKNSFPQMDGRSIIFHANTKAEAENLAKEYGRRILDRNLQYLGVA
jgi:hypothetical protein